VKHTHTPLWTWILGLYISLFQAYRREVHSEGGLCIQCRQAVRVHTSVYSQPTTNALPDIHSIQSALACSKDSPSSSPYPASLAPQRLQPSIIPRAMQTHPTPAPTNNTAPNTEATNMNLSPYSSACCFSASVHGGRGS